MQLGRTDGERSRVWGKESERVKMHASMRVCVCVCRGCVRRKHCVVHSVVSTNRRCLCTAIHYYDMLTGGKGVGSVWTLFAHIVWANAAMRTIKRCSFALLTQHFHEHIMHIHSYMKRGDDGRCTPWPTLKPVPSSIIDCVSWNLTDAGIIKLFAALHNPKAKPNRQLYHLLGA